MFAFGFWQDYIYLMSAFFLNTHWSNFLKSVLHHSRPQFEDPTLGEENHGVCAGEFGNPSGHTVLAAQFLLNFWWLYRERIQNTLGNKIYLTFGDIFIWV